MANRRACVTGFVLAAGVVLAAFGLLTDRPAAGQSAAPGAGAPSAQPAATAPVGAPPSGANFYYYSPRVLTLTSSGEAESEERHQLREANLQLDGDVNKMVAEYAAAAEDAKGEVKTRLQESLRKQFEARQKERDLEIAELEAQVKRLRELHQKREAAKAEIIESRLSQLVRSAEGLGWDGEGDGPRETAVRFTNTAPYPALRGQPQAR